MGLGIKYFMLLIFLISVYVAGMFIFAKGFLLKRVVVEKNSTCDVDFVHKSDQYGKDGCWMPKSFKKAVIIVIDALRYDFMAPYHPVDDNQLPYRNKFTSVGNFLSRTPQNSKLFKFIADPPTTTLQRLKGLTTGSLPTFVDAGANFASSEITEDNFIDQLVKQQKNIKFLGDDTWMGLFPERFYKSFPFPSFNVKDLHTVDNGILKNLVPQLRKKDWDVIIAHFLGVDHCGHRYGPDHPAMAEKLSQMDQMLRNVTAEMTEDTILFVLGDHGMTHTGDHGGDSTDELEAALFVYSPRKITTKQQKGEHAAVQQTDLVPTISLLLGLPIPFSNLGKVIPDLFTSHAWTETKASELEQELHSVKALRLNAYQINRYLREYYQHSSDFPISKYYQLDNLLSRTEADLQALITATVKDGQSEDAVKQLQGLRDCYTSYIEEVRSVCQGIWAKFDLSSIVIGLITLVVGLCLNLYLIKISLWWKPEVPTTTVVVFLVVTVYISFAIFQSFFIGESISAAMVLLLGCILICGLGILTYQFKDKNPLIINTQQTVWLNSLTLERCISVFMCVLYFGSFFSNSFVVYEDSLTVFLTQSLTWMYCVMTLKEILCKVDTSQVDSKQQKRHKITKTFDIMRVLTHPAMLSILLTLMFNITLRVSVYFRACREEQWMCENSVFLLPLGSLTDRLENYKNMRYFFSVGCIVVTLYLSRKWMKHFGNFNGASLTIISVKYLLPVSTVCCVLHWALQGLPQKLIDSLPVWQQVFLPQTVYFLVLLSLIFVIARPLCLLLVPQSQQNPQIPNNEDSLIPHLYNKLKRNMAEENDDKPPLVYGLATSFSAAVVSMVAIVTVLLSLLLSDGLSPSLLLTTLTAFFYLEILTVRENIGTPTSRWSSVVSFSLILSSFFFATGHQATITAIRWESAFIGFHGDFVNQILPGILIHLNTFASQVFYGVVSPLIIMWPLSEGVVANWIIPRKRDKKKSWRGDFALFENEDKLRKSLFTLFTSVVLFHGIKILGAACAAGLHRRHLMVWKIFAPRFVFEAMSCFTVYGISLLMYLFIFRIDQALRSWIKKVEKK